MRNRSAITKQALKKALFLSGAIIAMVLLLVPGTLAAQEQSPAADGVPGPWPGVTFRVGRMERIDDSHVTIFVQILLAADAKPTLIGHLSAEGQAANPSLPPLPIPYSMKEAVLQVGDRTYRPAAGSPYAAPEIAVWVKPRQGIEIPIEFDAPPPLPSGPDGTRPPQPVSLKLPETSQSINNLTLPDEASKGETP